MAKLAGHLEPTKTVRDRDWEWVPLPKVGGGLLTLTAHRARAADLEDIYWVKLDGDGVLLEKQGDYGADADPVVYRCVPDGLLAGCSCPAGRYRGKCKHRDALLAILSPPADAEAGPVVGAVVDGAELGNPVSLGRE